MTEQKACTLCGAGGHLAAQCSWAKSERAKFEAWVLRERPGSPLRFVRDALPVDHPRYGEYCDDTLQSALEGWLACAAQVGQVPESVRDELARRCLWLAFCWNDHNFGPAHVCAKEEAEKHGITSFDEANAWLAAAPQPAKGGWQR